MLMDPKPSSRQFATFFLDGLYFGVEVLKVQELMRYQEMTRAPLAPHVVRGLINLRGQIIMAIDLRRRFGMPEPAADLMPMNVVVSTADGAVSLLVDDIGDVVEVQEDLYEPVPESLKGRAADLVTGVYKMPDRLLLVLNVEQAIDVNRSMAGRAA
jgi:purine-binding chemotaxis protein CheW